MLSDWGALGLSDAVDLPAVPTLVEADLVATRGSEQQPNIGLGGRELAQHGMKGLQRRPHAGDIRGRSEHGRADPTKN